MGGAGLAVVALLLLPIEADGGSVVVVVPPSVGIVKLLLETGRLTNCF